jgi:hypothetical protein
MKKRIFSLACLAFFAQLYFSSCQKAENPRFEDSITTIHDESSDADYENDEISIRTNQPVFDYSQCPNVKSLVFKQGDKLVFQNIEHFEKCAICLEKDYDDYNDQYDALYPDATPEELDALDVINNFNEFAPYVSFEQSLSFASLRAKVENEFNAWLAATPAELIDLENDDPDDNCKIEDESMRALFNENELVIIGNAVKSADDFNNGNVYNSAFLIGDCSFWYSRTLFFDETEYPGLLDDRQLKVKVAIRSGIVTSKLRGKIKHYKIENGNFKLRRARLKVGVAGNAFDSNCRKTIDFWNKTKGYKNRKRRKVTHHIDALWREAITDKDDPRYSANRCIVNAFYINDNNYFPVTLYK